MLNAKGHLYMLRAHNHLFSHTECYRDMSKYLIKFSILSTKYQDKRNDKAEGIK